MTTWPPPPDLDSLKELVRNADTENFIANGSPMDEYDGEAEELQAAIASFATNDLKESKLLPIIESIWSKSFDYDEDQLTQRRPALESLAQQIARFFGPEAQPHTRAKP